MQHRQGPNPQTVIQFEETGNMPDSQKHMRGAGYFKCRPGARGRMRDNRSLSGEDQNLKLGETEKCLSH